MNVTVPYEPSLLAPSGALRTNDVAGAINMLTSQQHMPTDGKPLYIITGSMEVFEKLTAVAAMFNLACYANDLPDDPLVKGQQLITIMTKQDAGYHQMKPGDALVWEDPRMPQRHIHVWTVEGIHIGGTGQESVIALKTASHSPAWDETEITTMYVPEVLLRGCKVMQAKKVTVKATTGSDEEPMVEVEDKA